MLKRKTILIALGSLLVIASAIYLIIINSNSNNNTTDEYSFKNEYESLNGVLNEDTGKIIREVTISENNPIVLVTAEELVKKIDAKETFVVYFGFAKCPWCRSVIETLLQTAKDKEIDKIYYVDVLNIRDTYILENEELKLEKEGTKAYNELLEKLNSVLNDYTVKNGDGEKISTGEKRIYAPNVVAVVDGEAKIMKSGVSELQTDAYEVLTDEMINDTKAQFTEVFSYVKTNNMCTQKDC